MRSDSTIARKYPSGTKSFVADLNADQAFALRFSDRPTGRQASRRRMAMDMATAGVCHLEGLEDRKLLSTYVVTSILDNASGPAIPGSLRDAISQANANPGQDVIEFNIPGSGVQTISLLAALPTLSDAVVIDGTTQPGYVGMPLISVNGLNAGANVDGFVVAGGDSTINGLAINNFKSGAGIRIITLGNDTIQNSYIGIDPTGTFAMGNADGIVVTTLGNYIGTAGEGNVISGNSGNGIRISGAAGNFVDGNAISSNMIGTDAAGANAVGNGTGILLDYVSNTVVSANLISGNSNNGIKLCNSKGVVNAIYANLIGTDATGMIAMGNSGNGIAIINSGGIYDAGTSTVIGGILIGGAGANGNLISSNAGDGILLDNASYVQIQGNYIGTNRPGASTTDLNGSFLGNFGSGISLLNGSAGNLIGGPTAGARNLIDGSFGNNITINTGGTASNLIQGNYIGLDASGTIGIAGFGNNIEVDSAGASILNNVISASIANGINLMAAAIVQGNLIGTMADGVSPLPNISDGIRISSTGSIIGGNASGQGNTIAFNGANGINVVNGTANRIQRNSIYGNVKLGIDLNNDGITPNGASPRTGPNNLQNTPIITAASIGSSNVTITGTLTGCLPSATFVVELFADKSTDPTGTGRTYLGDVTVSTNAAGTASFSATIASLPAGQQYVSATATDSAGNTSEFSMAVQATVSQIMNTTQTQLSTSNACVFFGQSVTFTANVLFSGTNLLTGTVTFQEILADGSIVNLGGPVAVAGGSATLTLSSLAIGVHNIRAVYSGDANYTTSTSAPVAETIKSSLINISGYVLKDISGNGLSSDDAALANVVVKLYLDRNGNGVLDNADGAAVSQTTSGSTGAYAFNNLTAGKYFVQEVTPGGYIRTAPSLSSYYYINGMAGQVYTHQDFDNYMQCNDRQWVSCIQYNLNGSNCWFTDLRGHVHEGDTVKVRFTVAFGHTAKLTMVSYTAPASSFNANTAAQQQVYEFATGTFAKGTHTMTIHIPQCYVQVDFVCGDYIEHFGPAGSNIFYSAQNRLISADNGGVHSQLLNLVGATDMSVLNT